MEENQTPIQYAPTPVQMNQVPSYEPESGGGKKKIIIIAIVIIILIIFGIVGWVIWNYRFVVGPSTDIQIVTETATPEEVEEVFVDPFPNDKDRDGITDEEEIKLGTSEVEFDTDGDGLSDQIEINIWHTSPTNTDSDGDGFNDGWEVIGGYDPTGPGKLK